MKQCMDSPNLHRRLAKIIGQIQAIDRMIDEDIPCEDILSQINAAKSALNKSRAGCAGRAYQTLRPATASNTGMQTQRLKNSPKR